ncbi:MAG: biotin transporter BioY [Ignavibacteriaceae bacterium]
MISNSKPISEKLSFQILHLIKSRTFKIVLFAILTAVSAQVAIPVKPVPFTLQTMLVVLSGALLGARYGAYSQIFYLLLGITGLPVFAQVPDAPLGLARLIGPTGGYLIAFPAAAFLTGYLIEKSDRYLNVVLAMFAGSLLILFSGTLFLYVFYLHNFSEAVKAGAALFTIWAVVKIFTASFIYSGLKSSLKK